ncbi:protein FAM110C [Ctenodactylus gundi]
MEAGGGLGGGDKVRGHLGAGSGTGSRSGDYALEVWAGTPGRRCGPIHQGASGQARVSHHPARTWARPHPDQGVAPPCADFGIGREELGTILSAAVPAAAPRMSALLAPGVPGDPAARRGTHPARRSAVERLAADRAKFVRGARGPGQDPASEGVGSEARGRDVAPQTGGSGAPSLDHPAPPGGGPGAYGTQLAASASPARVPAPVARRAAARRSLRPDSLVIYRQKYEVLHGPRDEGSRGVLTRKLFSGPRGSRAAEPRDGGDAAHSQPCLGPPAPPGTAVPGPLPGPATERADSELRASRRAGLQRSRSDLSSRRSPAAADGDSFFRFCGLDPEVVEALGRENFSAGSEHGALRARSLSVATSEGGFSRRSGDDDGLQEAELREQGPSSTSVVERNARIIKWLYTCRRAKETPAQGLQGRA